MRHQPFVPCSILRSFRGSCELDTNTRRNRPISAENMQFALSLFPVVIRLKRSNVAGHLHSIFPNGPWHEQTKSRPKRAVAESVIPKEILAKEVARILEDQN